MTAAGGVLAVSVTLVDRRFKLATFPAGSTPPAWAQELITNPKAWRSAPESASTPEGGDEGPAEGPEETPEVASPEPDEAPQPEGPEPEDEDLLGSLPEPPRGGAGATKKAWAAYADSKGVTYDADANRDDIIAAVDAAAE